MREWRVYTSVIEIEREKEKEKRGKKMFTPALDVVQNEQMICLSCMIVCVSE